MEPMEGTCHGRQPNEEEGYAEEDPRKRQDVNRRLEAEQWVPYGGRSEEDATNDIQIEAGLSAGAGQKTNLEACCAEHLSDADNDGVQWPSTYLTRHSDL